MELWYFGMSFAGSQYTECVGGTKEWVDQLLLLLDDHLVGCDLQGVIFFWPSFRVSALRRYCAHRTNGAHCPYPRHHSLLINREAENGFHSTSASRGASSSPAFWMVPLHFGPEVLPLFCTFWLACRVAPLPGPCGAAEAPENHSCRGWLQRTGYSSWSCLEWEEARLPVDVRDR